jgi:hypothetical protein
MKIAVFTPKPNFTAAQQKQLLDLREKESWI